MMLMLRELNDTLRQNIMTIFVCFTIAGATVFVLVMIARLAKTTINNYKALVADASVNPKGNEDEDPYNDNAVYTKSEGESNMVPDSESVRIQSVLQRVKSRYSAYNREIARQLRDKGKPADDLIDEGILDPEQDDFAYGK